MNSQPRDPATRIPAMREGGLLMRDIKKKLKAFTKVGMSFAEIEDEAQRLIKATGGIPNFALVPNYNWATCVMRNDELCHGIPTQDKKVADGDLITIDVGMLYQGWHLDTSISFGVGKVSSEVEHFLSVGKASLNKAISRVKAGASVYEVSAGMQKVVEKAGYSAVYQLTGHGVGAELHDDPAIPCIAQRSDKRIKLAEGQTIAVEIMYAAGDAHLVLDKDGWTYQTADGSLSGMFEETVLVGKSGSEVLT